MRGSTEDRGTRFAWTVEQFDRGVHPQAIELMTALRAGKYIEQDERLGVPVRSYAQAQVDVLEDLQAQRSLRERAEDGDGDAVRQLVEEAARTELVCERLRERNERIRAHRKAVWAAEREGREPDEASLAVLAASREASMRLAGGLAKGWNARLR